MILGTLSNTLSKPSRLQVSKNLNNIFWRLNESKNRDCDYIISVNVVTFVILWKIKKFEEAKRYIEISRKIIDSLLEEEIPEGADETSLSVIMENTQQTIKAQEAE